MKVTTTLCFALLSAVSSAVAAPQASPDASRRPSSGASTTFSNAAKYMFDVNGNAIDSTSGKVSYINGQYVWVGVSYGCRNNGTNGDFCGVASWTSNDLSAGSWVYNGLLFDPSTATQCFGIGNCGRPKVLYNSGTQTYVLYMFAGLPGYIVYTSKTLTSGYSYVGRSLVAYQPPTNVGWDFSIVALDDGKAYIAYATWNLATVGTASIWPPFSSTVFVQELTADYLNGTGKAYPVVTGTFPIPNNAPATNLADAMIEAPDLFKRGSYYYVIASGLCSFCPGTPTIVYQSTSPQGPWKRSVISDDTCQGQAMGLAVIGTSYVYQADLFGSAPRGSRQNAAHGHLFQPLKFRPDGSVARLDCSLQSSFQVTVPAPQATVSTSGLANTATDGSGQQAAYRADNPIPDYTYYQTWSSSKSGQLTEVGVNVATLNPSANLTITVFRYPNEAALFNPYLTWETLGSVNVGLSIPVSAALEVVRVPLSSSVRRGDNLGISIGVDVRSSINSVPYSILFRDSVASNSHKLYSLRRGEVSYEGFGLANSPLQNVQGQEIKWYARVQ